MRLPECMQVAKPIGAEVTISLPMFVKREFHLLEHGTGHIT